jgi:stage III sporulation protein SpoIIIAA
MKYNKLQNIVKIKLINVISNLRTKEDLEETLNSISTLSKYNNDIENKEGTYIYVVVIIIIIIIIPFNFNFRFLVSVFE